MRNGGADASLFGVFRILLRFLQLFGVGEDVSIGLGK